MWNISIVQIINVYGQVVVTMQIPKAKVIDDSSSICKGDPMI
jgi:hypothetical protein